MRVRQENGNWLEFNRIENVERVYKILRDYLGADVSNACSNSSSSSSSNRSVTVAPLPGNRVGFHRREAERCRSLGDG